MKAMEYLGVGLPLVAYDVQETRRLAEGAGVLVTPGDTEALARELVSLLDDPVERARLGRVGRRTGSIAAGLGTPERGLPRRPSRG